MGEKKWLLFFSETQSRRPIVIRQILCNKRTVSNLYWGMQYHILDWLNVEPTLDEKKFDLQINKLIKNKYLLATPKGLVLTAEGIFQKKEYLDNTYVISKPYIFQYINEKRWLELLPLLVQVISELSYHNKKYYVVNSPLRAQFALKKWLSLVKDRSELPQVLKQKLLTFLGEFPHEYGNIFMALFTGHANIGQTAEQITVLIPQFSKEEILLLWRDLSMQFAFFLLKEDGLFRQLIAPFSNLSQLSKSTEISYQLFKENLTANKIATQRNLKISTIKEHLLESAILRNDFSYSKIITHDDYSILMNTFKGNPIDWEYRQLDNKIEFFKFRLFQIERSKNIG